MIRRIGRRRRRDVLFGAGGSKYPLTIPDCALFLDAADQSKVVRSGNLVAIWKDKTQNGYDFEQALSANQPEYGVGTINGKKTIRFVRSRSTILTNSDSPLHAVFASENTVFVVAKTLGTNYQRLWNATASTASRALMSIYDATQEKVSFLNDSATGFAARIHTAVTTIGTDAHIFAQRYDGTSVLEGFFEDQAPTGAATDGTSVNLFGIGNYPSGAPFSDNAFDGDIAEIIIYSRKLTDEEFNGVSAYLAAKYAVTPIVISAPPAEPPVNTVAPVMSGSYIVGQTLSVTNGTWTGSGISYSYQWRRDGVDIVGATNSTYTLVSADDSKVIACNVTATNTAGSASVLSNAIIALLAVLWLDPSDETSIIDASNLVSQINDKSGNNYHAVQATTAAQPLTKTATLNGKNVLAFDGTDDRMTFPAGAYSIPNLSAVTMFQIFSTTSTINRQSINAQDGGSNRFRFIRNTASQAGATHGSNTGQSNMNEPFVNGTPYTNLLISAASSGLYTYYRDGLTVIGSSAPRTAFTATSFTLGSQTGTSGAWHGNIGETIIFPRELTPQELNQVGNDLAGKWGTGWTNFSVEVVTHLGVPVTVGGVPVTA